MIVILVDYADYKVRIKIVSDSLSNFCGLLRGPIGPSLTTLFE